MNVWRQQGETEGALTQEGQQKRLPMNHTWKEDTSKAPLDMDMYIDEVLNQFD